MKIVVDAMGGDHSPNCVVQGAAAAIEAGFLRRDQLMLAGPIARVEPALSEHGLDDVEVVDAPEVIGMDESPTVALRTKRRSSITLGIKTVAEKRADAFVSAGNTGAVVAAASLILGRLKGILRPGIAVPMPSRSGPSVVIDVGANIYCKAEHLVQYAVMAAEYAKAALNVPDPVVGLLNIGEEEGKGNPLIQETHARLQSMPLNYIGFVEGQDIVGGRTDVVVCEGFVGNVILKVAEGLGVFVRDQVHAAFALHPPRQEVADALHEAFQRLDYAEYGGAPLLGVTAPVLIGHGRSDSHAIMNMIHAAAAAVEYDVNRHILERLEQTSGEAVP